jgi:uncharacterized protein
MRIRLVCAARISRGDSGCARARRLGGEFYPFRHEGRDGAETIAWLREHAACNGRIGMYGFSYQGATQLLAAAEQPEGLQCIAPHMTAADLYHGWFYHHGALRLSSSLVGHSDAARRCAAQIARGQRQAGGAWANIRAQAAHVPYAQHPAIAILRCPAMCATGLRIASPASIGPVRTSARGSIDSIPALHIAGWFDTYLEGSIAGYLALRNHAGSEFARENQYLIAGPWVHIPWGDRVGDANLGDAANLDTDARFC